MNQEEVRPGDIGSCGGDGFDYSQIDPGVREVVRVLREAGFQTSDSGDGKSKPQEWFDSGEVLPYAHVFAGANFTHSMLAEARLMLGILREKFPEMGPWKVEASYSANDESAMLLAYVMTGDELAAYQEQVRKGS